MFMGGRRAVLSDPRQFFCPISTLSSFVVIVHRRGASLGGAPLLCNCPVLGPGAGRQKQPMQQSNSLRPAPSMPSNSAVSESWGVFHNIYLHTSWGVHVFDYPEGNHTCLSSLLGGKYLISSWGVIPHILRHDKRSINILYHYYPTTLDYHSRTGSPGSTQAAGEYFFRNMV